MSDLAPIFPIERTHLDELTADLGIMQHAIGRRPDPAHGYCTDDVARALLVDLLHAGELGWPAVEDSAGRSMAFLDAAFVPASGRFRNFRSVAGEWLDTVGSEDAHARALLALAEVSKTAGDSGLRAAATALFARALPAAMHFTHLRPIASAVIACETAARQGDPVATHSLPELASLLSRQVGAGPGDGTDWPWPAASLTYESGIVPRALIRAGDRLRDRRMLDRGLGLLDWLVTVQTADEGHFSPIGNRGWWPRGGTQARYDQQPIEATALLLAAEAAFEVDRDPRHQDTMEWAYGWFLGRNDLGVQVALPGEGACNDGLTRTGANTNQGAESTLMWLIALERIRVARRSPTARSTRHGGGGLLAAATA
jgi:hypothetical protein